MIIPSVNRDRFYKSPCMAFFDYSISHTSANYDTSKLGQSVTEPICAATKQANGKCKLRLRPPNLQSREPDRRSRQLDARLGPCPERARNETRCPRWRTMLTTCCATIEIKGCPSCRPEQQMHQARSAKPSFQPLLLCSQSSRFGHRNEQQAYRQR